MKAQEHYSQVAVAWAQALLELANERKQAEEIGRELSQIGELVQQDEQMRVFLANPAVGEIERGDVIKRTFGGRIDPMLVNFMLLLNTKRRLAILSEIAAAYDDLIEEQLGKIEVDVIVAQKLSAEQLEEVRQRVGAALKKDAVVHQYVDDSIIGGLVIRVQDQVIDASVKAQLTAMKRQLLTARTK